MFKKFLAALVALATVCSVALPVMTASAVSTNLILNPSVETVAAGNTTPANWSQGKWGTNTTVFSYPTNGHTGTRSNSVQMTSYTSGDAKWYFTHTAVKPNQQYTYTEFYKSSVVTEIDIEYADTAGKLSYVSLALPAVSATTWQQSTATFTTPANVKTLTIFHTLNKVGTLQTDDFSLSEGSTPVDPQPPVPTAPTVTLTAPAVNAVLSGSTTLQATASDAVGVSGVQFKVDNVNVGSEDTLAPYAATLDTTTLTNGNHTVSATARNAAALTASASAVVTVQNTSTPNPVPNGNNLISNPSFETAASTTSPQSWTAGTWGTNTTVFSYLTTGRTGNRSVKVEATKYTSGASNWFYAGVPVTAGKTYKYENWYKSNVDSEIDAEVRMNDGTIQYFYLGAVFASTDWAKASAIFSVPTGAKTLAIYQILTKKGFITSDDYSLVEYTPAQLSRGLVSINFDDGWRSIATSGLPLLKKYGLVSTQYLNSQPVIDGYPDYMTYQNVKDFVTQGSEVAWHTRTHADLTTLTTQQLNTELSIPAAFLTGTGQPLSAFKNFASPFGAYNAAAISAIKKLYRSHRGVESGYNTKDSFDIYNIKVQNILNTTTPAEVQGWINKALAEKTWLVILYHEVDTAAEDPTYAVTPANLDKELNIIKQSGITVKTVNQALDEVTSQL